MHLQVSFDELNSLISQKTPVKGLTLSYSTPNTATVSFIVNILGLLSPFVSARVTVVSIDGPRVTAEVDAGSMGGWILDKAKKPLTEKVPEGLIESFEGKRIILNLSAIPELKTVFESLTVNGLSFTEDAVCLDASMK